MFKLLEGLTPKFYYRSWYIFLTVHVYRLTISADLVSYYRIVSRSRPRGYASA